ncbi:ABC transporter substrate-binding protein [Marinibacterium sp. SX1]|uniref:ABC transporter substrate-binding protein n=1 Tax=Marinibacterium sp. SX1 TaxID=3388424 RepID=UPI003D16288A
MFTKYRTKDQMAELYGPADPSRRKAIKTGLVGGGAALGGTMLSAINADARATGEPILIGGANPLTGWAASDGLEFRNGLDLAVEEINAMGGILGRPLEVIHDDIKSMSGDDTSQAFRRLIDRNGVNAVFTGYAIGSQNAEYDVVADAGVIYMNMNTLQQHVDMVTGEPDKYWGCFQGDPSEYWYGPGYLKFISALRDSGQWVPQNNKLAIISGSSTYSLAIASAIEKEAQAYGWELAFAPEVVATPTSEWGPVLQKCREVNPAAICNTHFVAAEIAACQNQFMQNPTNSLMYYQYGPILKAFSDIAQDNANGVLASILLASLRDEVGMAFDQKYKAKFGEDTTPSAGLQTYSMLHHWAIAAALSGGPGEPGNVEQNRKVAENIKRITFRTPGGTMTFHPEYQMCMPYPGYTDDPTLGMPHLYYQIQDWTKTERALISPAPYAPDQFVLPPWMS